MGEEIVRTFLLFVFVSVAQYSDDYVASLYVHSFIANLFPKLSHNNDIQYWKR